MVLSLLLHGPANGITDDSAYNGSHYKHRPILTYAEIGNEKGENSTKYSPDHSTLHTLAGGYICRYLVLMVSGTFAALRHMIILQKIQP